MGPQSHKQCVEKGREDTEEKSCENGGIDGSAAPQGMSGAVRS